MASPSTTAANSPSATSASAACTSVVPDKYGHVPLDACNSQYPYDPIFAGDCAFAVLFGLSLAAHFVQAVAWKKKFCWVLLMGASWEFLSFVLKSLGAHDQQNAGYVASSQLLFLLAPLWINAFAYMTGARLVYFILPDQRVFKIKATMLTTIFVWIDVFCFCLQAAGGGMMSVTDVAADDPILVIGRKLYLAGCGLQIGSIAFFCSIMARLYIKVRQSNLDRRGWWLPKILIWVMFAVLVLIIIRIIYRLAEYGPNTDGSETEMSTNEHYALALDALPMFLALMLLNVIHPGWVLRGPNSEFPPKPKKAKKSKKSKKQQQQEQEQKQDEEELGEV